MESQIAAIAAKVPAWTGANEIRIEPAKGLTNTNHLVTVDDKQYVLRVGSSNAAHLGIDRDSELAALQSASSVGIGAELIHFILPQGHLVTRLIKGRHLTYEEYCNPGNLERIVETVRRVHNLPRQTGAFSPFRRVKVYARKAAEYAVWFPPDFSTLLDSMQLVESTQRKDSSDWLKFCHNDLFSVNMLDDGSIRIIDWEFAGMGDVYFDLATLVYAYDTHGPLPAELQEYLLHLYFGRVTSENRERFEGMKFMVLFFAAMWGLLQHGLVGQGIVPAVDGFDYLIYAQNTFELMRETLWTG